MTDWADYICDTSEPPGSEEQALQFALVDFRTMKPETQKAFMIAVLDEYTARAKEGPFDPYFAGQMLTRVQLIASFINARPQPGLKMVSNNVR